MKKSLLCFALAVPLAVAEVHQVVAQKYYNSFHHRYEVLKRVRSGDTVVTKTLDGEGFDEKGVRRGVWSNPLTGPFYVEGAEQGDALVIQFCKIRMNRKWGHTSSRLLLSAVTPDSIETVYPSGYRESVAIKGRSGSLPWDLDIEKLTARLREPVSKVAKFEFSVKPMLGCVGVAAGGDFGPSSGMSGSYGGNMDYNEVVEGATLLLPVYHPGGLLFMGDGHALQADGEPIGTGVETSMDVEFTVGLRKKANLSGPRVENSEYIISVGSQPEFASPLDRALQLATTDMVNWLVKEYGMEPWAAHQMIGCQGKYNVITVMGCVGLKIPRKVLPARQ